MEPKLSSKNWRYSTNLNSSKQFICNNSSANSNSGNCYSNNSNIYKNSRYLISICSSTNSKINIRPSKGNFDNRSSICRNSKCAKDIDFDRKKVEITKVIEPFTDLFIARMLRLVVPDFIAVSKKI